LVDDEGKDVLEESRPREFDELHDMVRPRDEHVFFGAWDPDAPPKGMAERVFRLMPISKEVLPVGDFRDWEAIDSWADEIVAALGVGEPSGETSTSRS
jgi:menaquinone-dependent protoporphyrinogen oxidase